MSARKHRLIFIAIRLTILILPHSGEFSLLLFRVPEQSPDLWSYAHTSVGDINFHPLPNFAGEPQRLLTKLEEAAPDTALRLCMRMRWRSS